MDGIKASYNHHKHYFPDQDQTNEDYYEGPRFDFPKLTTTPSSTLQHIKDTIVTTAKTLVTDIFEPSVKDSTEQNVTAILMDNGTNLNNTILDEGLATINNTVTDVMESTNSSVVTDLFQRNNTLDIMTSDNGTFVNATDVKDSGLLTTTENIINYVTNATKNLVSSTTKKYDWSDKNENHNLTMSHQGSDNYDDHYQTTYIVMGVIIAILLIVIGVITYFYVTHKKKHVVAMQGQYTTSSQREGAHGSTVKSLESPDDGQSNYKC